MIVFENIEKSFREQLVLKKINLTVKEGELLVLLGKSGSGKTTMLRMINGLEQPDSGSIVIDDQPLDRHPILNLRKDIGYVIQKVGLFPHYTVHENVATVLKLKHEKKASIKQRVEHWLSKMGMKPSVYAHKYPDQLSGGEAQRIGLARALVAQPKMILMDEPFSALDPISRVQIRKEFRKIQQDQKLTAVMVTHDVLEAVTMADRICLLSHGEIQQIGTAQEIIFKPENDLVKSFVKGDQFQAALASVSLAEIAPFLDEDFLVDEDRNISILDFLQKAESKYHSEVLNAFYNWKGAQS